MLKPVTILITPNDVSLNFARVAKNERFEIYKLVFLFSLRNLWQQTVLYVYKRYLWSILPAKLSFECLYQYKNRLN